MMSRRRTRRIVDDEDEDILDAPETVKIVNNTDEEDLDIEEEENQMKEEEDDLDGFIVNDEEDEDVDEEDEDDEDGEEEENVNVNLKAHDKQSYTPNYEKHKIIHDEQDEGHGSENAPLEERDYTSLFPDFNISNFITVIDTDSNDNEIKGNLINVADGLNAKKLDYIPSFPKTNLTLPKIDYALIVSNDSNKENIVSESFPRPPSMVSLYPNQTFENSNSTQSSSVFDKTYDTIIPKTIKGEDITEYISNEKNNSYQAHDLFYKEMIERKAELSLKSYGFYDSSIGTKPIISKRFREEIEQDEDDKQESVDIPLVKYKPPLNSDLDATTEYDMDEVDLTFLKLYYPNVSKNLFEKFMDLFEKEWYQFTCDTSVPKQTVATDNNCNVCGEDEAYNSNAIVFCDGCDVGVHQDCYGVPYIPEGQWLCRKCMLEGPNEDIACPLCPETKGAYKRTAEGGWAHLICALWIPETGVANSTFMEPIIGIPEIPKSRWKLGCYLCKQKVGAPIQCANKNCYTAFHAACGRNCGLYMKLGDENVAFCDRHIPKNLPPDSEQLRGSKLIEVIRKYQALWQKKGHTLSHSNSTDSFTKRGDGKSGGGKSLLLPLSLSKSNDKSKTRSRGDIPIIPKFILDKVVDFIDLVQGKQLSEIRHFVYVKLKEKMNNDNGEENTEIEKTKADILAAVPEFKDWESLIEVEKDVKFNDEAELQEKFKEIIQKFEAYLIPLETLQELSESFSKYWSLKRKALSGAALIKRLIFEPWSIRAASTPGGPRRTGFVVGADDTLTEEEQEALEFKIGITKFLRKDLEQVRALTDYVCKREKAKRRLIDEQFAMIEMILTPISAYMTHVVDRVQAWDVDNFFSHPVPTDIVTDYRDVVKEPMDFFTLRNKLQTLEYENDIDLFEKHLKLIFQNAMLYNRPDTNYAKLAKRLLATLDKEIAVIRTLKDQIDSKITESKLYDKDLNTSLLPLPSDLPSNIVSFIFSGPYNFKESDYIKYMNQRKLEDIKDDEGEIEEDKDKFTDEKKIEPIDTKMITLRPGIDFMPVDMDTERLERIKKAITRQSKAVSEEWKIPNFNLYKDIYPIVDGKEREIDIPDSLSKNLSMASTPANSSIPILSNAVSDSLLNEGDIVHGLLFDELVHIRQDKKSKEESKENETTDSKGKESGIVTPTLTPKTVPLSAIEAKPRRIGTYFNENPIPLAEDVKYTISLEKRREREKTKSSLTRQERERKRLEENEKKRIRERLRRERIRQAKKEEEERELLLRKKEAEKLGTKFSEEEELNNMIREKMANALLEPTRVTRSSKN